MEMLTGRLDSLETDQPVIENNFVRTVIPVLPAAQVTNLGAGDAVILGMTVVR